MKIEAGSVFDIPLPGALGGQGGKFVVRHAGASSMTIEPRFFSEVGCHTKGNESARVVRAAQAPAAPSRRQAGAMEACLKQRWRWVYEADYPGGHWYNDLTGLAYMWSYAIMSWRLVETWKATRLRLGLPDIQV